VEATRATYPGADLLYLIGEDNIPALETWHRIHDLRRQVEFVVFGRGLDRTPHPFCKLERQLDVSATEIRERVARGLSIRYLVPEPVRALIEQHRLYLPQNSAFR
jgi:nicotinate-nucleotide adenylyltransferase